MQDGLLHSNQIKQVERDSEEQERFLAIFFVLNTDTKKLMILLEKIQKIFFCYFLLLTLH